jgi:TP901 family phage tail tape measure protein
MAGTLASLFVELGLRKGGLDKGISDARRDFKKLGSDFRKVGAGFSAAFTLPAIAAAGGLLKIGKEWDDVLDTLETDTGATGKELDALGKSVTNVFKSIPTDLNLAADAIALISQKTGLVGPQLEKIAKQELELARITETDLATNISATTELFDQWQISTEKQSATLDMLFRASQLTGVPVAELANQLDKFGPILRSFGFGLEESAALLANLGQAGVDPANIITGLRTAFAGFSKEGVTDTNKALEDVFNTIRNSTSDVEAAGIGLEVFGNRAGIQMADLIRNGTLSFDELLKLMKGSDSTILGTAEATNDLAENWKIFTNRLKVAFIPIATKLFNWLNGKGLPILTKMAKIVERLVKWWDTLARPIKIATALFAALLVAIGPVLVAIGFLIPIVTGAMAAFAPAIAATATTAAVAAGPLAGLGATIAGLLLPLTLIIGAVVLLALAWKHNWFDIQGKTKSVIKYIWGVIHPFVDKFMTATKTIRTGIRLIGDAFKKGGIKGALRALFGDAGQIILKGLGRILGLPLRIIGQFLREIRTGFAPLDALLHNVGAMFQDVGLIIQAIFSGQWSKAFDLAWDLLKRFLNQYRLIGELLLGIFEAIPWTKIGTKLWNGFVDAVSFLVNTGGPWLIIQASKLLGKMQRGFGEKWDSTIHPWIKSLPGKIVSLLEAGATIVQNAGRFLLGALWTGIASLSSWLWNQIWSLAKWLATPFISIYNDMWSAGHYIMTGIYDGLKWVWDNVIVGFLKSVSGAIPFLKGPIAKDKVMLVPAGEMIMAGLGVGLEAGWKKVGKQLSGYTAEIGGGSAQYQRRPMPAVSGSGGGHWAPVTFAPGSIVVHGAAGQNEERIAEMTAKKIVRKIYAVQAGST